MNLLDKNTNFGLRESMKNVFWIAGENSGDLHAANVLRQLRARGDKSRHYGIGGPRMQTYGFQPIFPFERFAVMGFAEVVKHLRFFLKVRASILRQFQTNPPDLVVLVDYPGLNLQVAKIADELDIPVLYYICPQFWAWKHRRVEKLKRYTRQVACILPFESDLLDFHRVNNLYVGHPVAEEIEIRTKREEFASKFKLDSSKKWIGFLPGSREMEFKKMMPVYIEAIKKLDPSRYEFLISKARTFPFRMFFDLLKRHELPYVHVIDEDPYDLMYHADALAATSGTVTLEAAYIGTPTAICYKTSRISYEIGKRLVRIKRIGLPNIVLNETVLPELIQRDANGANVARTLEGLLEPASQRHIRGRLSHLHDLLGTRSASGSMASLIEYFLENGEAMVRVLR
jgi:lipid-A-disaccharide synthase